MFTTKYTKAKGKRPPPMVSKFAEGGSVPLPKEDPRTNDLLDEEGNPAGPNFRKLSTKRGWKEEAARERQNTRDYGVSAVGSSDRSIGEHLLAGARGVFEGTEFRRRESEYGKRDRANPLYDRKKAPPEED